MDKNSDKIKNIEKKYKSSNKFLYNFTERHKNYIFEEEIGTDTKNGIGITHSPITFNETNIRLKENPQKTKINGIYVRKEEPSYIRSKIVTGDNYGGRQINNLSFTRDDFSIVKSLIRNFKKNRKKNKRKTKNKEKE